MFNTLLESRARRMRRTGGTAASVLLHAGLIGAAVAVTIPVSTHQLTDPLTPVVYMPAPMRPQQPVARNASAQEFGASTPSPILPAPIDVHVPSTNSAPVAIEGPSMPPERISLGSGIGTHVDGQPSGLSGHEPDGVVPEAFVERAPRLVGESVAPRYPDALRASGISGQVIARFVVDTLGHAEMNDVVTLDATHPLFADAVRAALARYRFSPGEVGGRKVRTMVQLPFTFSLK